MIKDTTTITTYKFTSVTPKPENKRKVLELKAPLKFKSTKDAKKNLRVKQYRVTDVLGE